MGDSPIHETATALRKLAQDVEDGQVAGLFLLADRNGQEPMSLTLLPPPGPKALQLLGLVDNGHAALRITIAQSAVRDRESRQRIVPPTGQDRAAIERSKR